MSGSGHSRRFGGLCRMSAPPPIATEERISIYVGEGAKTRLLASLGRHLNFPGVVSRQRRAIMRFALDEVKRCAHLSSEAYTADYDGDVLHYDRKDCGLPSAARQRYSALARASPTRDHVALR